jgi:hypothetical protein
MAERKRPATRKPVENAIYSLATLTTGEKPGDRLDGKYPDSVLDVLLRDGHASHTKPE